MVASQRGFDTKILASYEILDYCKYGISLTMKDSIGNHQNHKSLLKFKTIITVVRTLSKTFRFNTPKNLHC